MNQAVKNLVRLRFKKAVPPLLGSLGRPESKVSGVSAAETGGAGSWQQGLAVAQGTGWEPGARCRKRGHVGQGRLLSRAAGVGSECS